MSTFTLQPSTSNTRGRGSRVRIGCSILNVGGLLLVLISLFAIPSGYSAAATFLLFSVAQVDGEGVFLQQVVKSRQPLPAMKLCDSPAFGKTTELSRAQVNDLIAAAAPDLATTNWTGAESIHLSRRSHEFSETEMLALLTATLQRDCVKDRGELELDLTQPWTAPLVPDEPLTLKILEQPAAGVAPSCIVRFEICTAHETLGAAQVSLQAHIWREVWVARSTLQRSEPVADADIARERRDILNVHEALADFTAGDGTLEIAGFVNANAPLLARDVRPKIVIHRGQTADARLEDGTLTISTKVVALEDGAPGQTIRLRNPVSQRNLNGTVLNGNTILVSL